VSPCPAFFLQWVNHEVLAQPSTTLNNGVRVQSSMQTPKPMYHVCSRVSVLFFSRHRHPTSIEVCHECSMLAMFLTVPSMVVSSFCSIHMFD
jgi:hypothetical protein